MLSGAKTPAREFPRGPQAVPAFGEVVAEPRPPAPAKWIAIILAGERPGIDPLAKHFGLASKAMVPVCGQPMRTRVLRAMLLVPAVGRNVVLAQRQDALHQAGLAWLAAEPGVMTASLGKSIPESLKRIVGLADAPWPVLVTSADYPLLTRELTETFLSRAAENEIAVGVVERKTVFDSYPETSRASKLWARAEQDRKHQAKLLWHFGPWLAFRAATRTIGSDAALRRVGRNLDISAAAVQLPFAEAAIGVDKVIDHRMVE